MRLFRGLKQSAIRLCGCSGGLQHVIVLRFGGAFFDETFIIAPPLVILIVTGSLWRFMSGRARHRVPALGFGC